MQNEAKQQIFIGPDLFQAPFVIFERQSRFLSVGLLAKQEDEKDEKEEEEQDEKEQDDEEEEEEVEEEEEEEKDEEDIEDDQEADQSCPPRG